MTTDQIETIKKHIHLTDREIGEKIGMSGMSVYLARKRHGLHKDYRPRRKDGDIVVRQSGKYKSKFIRLAPSQWMPYARYVWLQHHGELIGGQSISFRDGNPLNCDITNLQIRGQRTRGQRKPDKRQEIKTTGKRHKDVFNGRVFECKRCGRVSRGHDEFPAMMFTTGVCK